MKNQYKKSIIFFALIFTIGFGLISFPKISLGENITSDGKYTVLAPLPCIEGSGIECNGPNGGVQERVDFKTYVQYTFNLLIGLSAVTAVILIVWSGIQYIISTSILNKQSSLDRAKNALIGLVLILTSFIILRTVDPRFTEIPNTLVPKIEISSFLANDSYSKLIESIDNDTKKYTEKGIEIGKEVTASKAEVNASVAKINELANKIENLKKTASTTEELEVIKNMETQMKQELGKTDSKIIELNVNEFKVDVNGLIRDSLNRMSESVEQAFAQEDKALAMKQLNSNKQALTELKNKRIQNFQTLGELDLSQINNLDTYGQNILNLYRIRLMNSSTREIYPDKTRQITGGIEAVDFDGTVLTFPTKESLRKIILAQLRKTKDSSNSFSSAKDLKDNFDTEYNKTLEMINQNEDLK